MGSASHERAYSHRTSLTNGGGSTLQCKMMNTFLLIIIFLFSFSSSCFSSDTYYVIHVKDAIIVKNTGTLLKVGDAISSEEELVFKSPNAVAAVISPQKGRFTLSAREKHSEGEYKEFVDLVRNLLMPSTHRVSTRSGVLNNLVDLKNHFEGDNYLIIEKVLLIVDANVFPMADTAFFYVRYTFDNEFINKKLKFNGDTLIIDPKTLYTIEGDSIQSSRTSDTKLYYYRKKAEQSILIAEFNPVIPDETLLRKECMLLISQLKKQEKDAISISNEVIAFLNEFYGKPDIMDVTQWLDKTSN